MMRGFAFPHSPLATTRFMSDIAPQTAEPTSIAAPAVPVTADHTPAAIDVVPADAAATEATPQPAPARDNPRGGQRDNRARGNPRNGPRQGSRNAPRPAKAPGGPSHPVLTQLAELEPTLFGAKALPMKRGIFQDLMAAHPEALDKDTLKLALGLYARSTRYLLAMASGELRHDLAGNAVETVAPEHQYHALLETFRRRHARTGEDVRQPLYTRILQAAETSGMSPADYAALVRSKDEAANEILDAAMVELGTRVARDEALLRAFEAKSQSVNDFADAYGLHPIEAAATLSRAKARVAHAAAVADATAAAEAAAAVAAQAEPDSESDSEPVSESVNEPASETATDAVAESTSDAQAATKAPADAGCDNAS
jgi:ProP effector